MSIPIWTQQPGASELLSTKLTPPRLRAALVVRAPLLARLNQAIHYKLTLVSAPAGFGKTMLAAAWLQHLAREQGSKGAGEQERKGAGEQRSRGAGEQGSKGAGEQGSRGAGEKGRKRFSPAPHHPCSPAQDSPSPHHPCSPAPLHVSWLSLDPGDNDPVRFWRYVIAACRQFDPAVGQAALAQLGAPQPAFGGPQLSTFEAALTTLVNDLAQLPQHCILVLDDYHLITEAQIQATVIFLLDHLPAQIHLLLLSRSDLPLPLARLRARNELLELPLAELRFSLEESRIFLQQTLSIPLAPEAITLLHERAEGWVAGLHLAALALQGRLDAAARHHFLTMFTGNYRPVLEYLVSDVLSVQPEAIQTFLLQTSGLSRLTPSLCNAVTGRDDSDLRLAQIERAGLFLEPLDGSGQWYRYHALFAEAMQQEARRRLGEEKLRALSDQASGWYEQHGMLAEAIEAALYAQDFTRAAKLIEGHTPPERLHETLEYHTLRRWLEQIPPEILRQRLVLSVLYAMLHLFIPDRHKPVNMAQLDDLLQQAGQIAQAEAQHTLLGGMLTLRALICVRQGNLPQARQFARQARPYLPGGQPAWGGAHVDIAEVMELLEGIIEPARLATLEQFVLVGPSADRPARRALMPPLGNVYVMQGRLRQAAGCYHQTLTLATEDQADQAAALNGLAALSYERNELARAEQEATEALNLSESIGYDSLRVSSTLTLVRVQYGRGQIEQAQHQLAGLLTWLDPASTPQLYRLALAGRAWLHLRTGDLAMAQHWRAGRPLQPGLLTPLQQEQEELLAARLWLAQNNGAEALRLLGPCEETASAHHRSLVEILALKALAYFCLENTTAGRRPIRHTPHYRGEVQRQSETAQGRPPTADGRSLQAYHNSPDNLVQAKQSLREALALALPEGYCRLFLDEGEQMAALLQALLPDLKEAALSDYVRSLLQAFTNYQSAISNYQLTIDNLQLVSPSQSIIVNRSQRPPVGKSKIGAGGPLWVNPMEPLSPQEERVLRLLAAGLSNPEIAGELVVSVNTIKTQIQSIYRKLDVHNRDEAGEAAQRLGLL